METDNNVNINVDEILHDLRVTPSPTPSPDLPASSDLPEGSSVVPVSSSDTFSDEDIDDILQENGFAGTTEEVLVNTDEQESLSESMGVTVEDLDTFSPPRESVEEEEEEEESTEDTEDEGVALTPNSPTLLLDEANTRFSGAEWFNEIQKARIILGGCGGIGSNLAFQVSRMHPAELIIYDDDEVNKVNMAGQLFGYHDLGKSKVSAIASMISSYTNMDCVHSINQRFTPTTEAGDIMMCGFDNMAARRTFYYAWSTHVDALPANEKGKCLFLDGRLSMDTLQILCIKGDDSYNMRRYQNEFLFRDSEADATVCSMKQTTYLACMIASLMTNLFTNFIAGTLDPIIPYDLPFFIEYDAQNMLFKTEN